jgi:hypothetical protein
MTTIPYDAGAEREALAHELACWKAAGFIASEQAWRWHRRARRLAAVCDLRVDYVKANLEADADEILAHDE